MAIPILLKRVLFKITIGLVKKIIKKRRERRKRREEAKKKKVTE